jgi:hypothetical protein
MRLGARVAAPGLRWLCMRAAAERAQRDCRCCRGGWPRQSEVCTPAALRGSLPLTRRPCSAARDETERVLAEELAQRCARGCLHRSLCRVLSPLALRPRAASAACPRTSRLPWWSDCCAAQSPLTQAAVVVAPSCRLRPRRSRERKPSRAPLSCPCQEAARLLCRPRLHPGAPPSLAPSRRPSWTRRTAGAMLRSWMRLRSRSSWRSFCPVLSRDRHPQLRRRSRRPLLARAP